MARRPRLRALEDACSRIREEHACAIKWMCGLHEFRETEAQVFVRAGVQEHWGVRWRLGTTRDYMLDARDAPTGTFAKDVIAGHTPVSAISGDESHYDVFWDGVSHFYLEGSPAFTGFLPVLAYGSDERGYWKLDERGCPIKIED